MTKDKQIDHARNLNRSKVLGKTSELKSIEGSR